jgi:uncharacterized membrane protein
VTSATGRFEALRSTEPSRRRRRLGRVLGAFVALIAVGSVAIPTAVAAGTVTLSTPYPAVAVAPGSKVSFDLSVVSSASERVALAVSKAPAGWTAVLHGGGYVVDGVQTQAGKAATVRLDLTVPADAAAATGQLEVTASNGNGSTTLPLAVRVTPEAGGKITMTTDTPQLRGASDASFNFTVTLNNDTAEDVTVAPSATGPTGWTVDAKVNSSSQAASAVVKAGSTASIDVTANPPAEVTAGTYPISLRATTGAGSVQQDLAVEITGRLAMTLTTPDGRLNANASAGSASDYSLVVRNGGTAPLQGVSLSATPPTGWNVTFDPSTPIDVPPNNEQTVHARITPSGQAIAGDYVISFKATANDGSATQSADVRVTVETSLLYGALGIGLIVLVLLGLGWVFRTYGRR